MNSEKPKSLQSQIKSVASPEADVGTAQPGLELGKPSLASYFGPEVIPAAAFTKAVRKAKLTHFSADDVSLAAEALPVNDPDGSRLWGLMSQAHVPEVLERWAWQAIQERLKSRIGESFDPAHSTTGQLSAALRANVRVDLQSLEKEKQKAAENWLRLGILWLVVKRSLDPWQALEESIDLLYKREEALRVAAQVVRRGKWIEFCQAAAIGETARTIVEQARRERDEERRVVLALQRQLSAMNGELDALRSRASALERDLVATRDALDESKASWEADRVHRGHALAETRASQRVLLSERIGPLVGNAIDALEIEPPAPEVALRRLKSILSIIAEKSL